MKGFNFGRRAATWLPLVLAAALPAGADVAGQINYQGTIRGAAGQPLSTGSYCADVAIYDSSTGTTPVWGPERFDPLQVNGGYFNVVLGQIAPLDGVFGQGPRYVGVTVGDDCASLGDEIAPRQLILSAPSALAAGSLVGAVRTAPGDVGGISGHDALDVTRFSLTGDVDGGRLVLNDETGATRMIAGVDGAGASFQELHGANDTLNVRLGAADTSSSHGAIGVHDAAGARKVRMESLSGDGGYVSTSSPAGSEITVLRGLESDRDYGEVTAYGPPSAGQASIYVDPTDQAGALQLNGPNSLNVFAGARSDNVNHGQVTVYDANGNAQAGIYVNTAGNGVIWGDTKSFVVRHPLREDDRIVYISSESPEAVISFVGKVRLDGGRARIDIPEHFAALAAEDRVTVNLTPHSLGSKGLAVVTIEARHIEIGELFDGQGGYDVSYEVQSVRNDRLDHRPVITDDEFQRTYGARPRIDVSSSANGTVDVNASAGR